MREHSGSGFIAFLKRLLVFIHCSFLGIKWSILEAFSRKIELTKAG